jgi:hypothetical protein
MRWTLYCLLGGLCLMVPSSLIVRSAAIWVEDQDSTAGLGFWVGLATFAAVILLLVPVRKRWLGF